jgi:JmjC domain, hydroxylase
MQVYVAAVSKLRKQGKSEAEIQVLVNDALAKKTTMVNPAILLAAGIPVTRIVQHPGEMVITFPRGYHAGFSAGHNLGEAANFGLPHWFEFGLDGAQRSLQLRTTPVWPCSCLNFVH